MSFTAVMTGVAASEIVTGKLVNEGSRNVTI